ncbi:MAG: hypothetical protein K0Q68_271 [Moraxellaceae bacterium]|jgi:RimJ/RimL family protein N-acetyltransferase|nr:hypothetical protein [Moraxellaceae bacterium]
MIIRKYGISLHRVQHGDIELIRAARNRDDIRSRMFEQTLISSEQQEAWFLSINNMQNYFFLIYCQDKPVGLIHAKDVDLVNGEAEGGMFIWEQSLLGTAIPAKASIIFMEFAFSFFVERAYIRVREDNPQAYRYNVAMGYEPAPEKGKEYLVLTRQTYESRIRALRKLASGGRDSAPLSIDDVEIPNAESQMHLYGELPEKIFQRFAQKLPPRSSDK